MDAGQKRAVLERLAEHYRHKIDLADAILVINVDGYMGESTRAEIEYARQASKRVRCLEADAQQGAGLVGLLDGHSES